MYFYATSVIYYVAGHLKNVPEKGELVVQSLVVPI